MMSPIFLKKDKLDFDTLLTWFKEFLSSIQDYYSPSVLLIFLNLDYAT